MINVPNDTINLMIACIMIDILNNTVKLFLNSDLVFGTKT